MKPSSSSSSSSSSDLAAAAHDVRVRGASHLCEGDPLRVREVVDAAAAAHVDAAEGRSGGQAGGRAKRRRAIGGRNGRAGAAVGTRARCGQEGVGRSRNRKQERGTRPLPCQNLRTNDCGRTTTDERLRTTDYRRPRLRLCSWPATGPHLFLLTHGPGLACGRLLMQQPPPASAHQHTEDARSSTGSLPNGSLSNGSLSTG